MRHIHSLVKYWKQGEEHARSKANEVKSIWMSDNESRLWRHWMTRAETLKECAKELAEAIEADGK